MLQSAISLTCLFALGLIVGLVRPSLFQLVLKDNANRGVLAAVFGFLLIIGLAWVEMTMPTPLFQPFSSSSQTSPSSSNPPSPSSNTPTTQTPSSVTPTQTPTPTTSAPTKQPRNSDNETDN